MTVYVNGQPVTARRVEYISPDNEWLTRQKDPIFTAKPEAKDYAGAQDFLGLLFADDVAKALVAQLKKAPVVQLRVNDILRASRQGPADKDDPGVQSETKNIKDEVPLGPVLLIQGDRARGIFFTIADGYHRLSAMYHRDPSQMVPAQLAKPNWSALDRPHE